MPRLASTAPDGKLALFQLLTTAPALEGVTVTWAEQAEEPVREAIRIGDVTGAASDWANLGSRRRREEYRIQTDVSVLVEGPDAPRLAEARAWEIAESVAAAVRQSLTFDGLEVPPALALERQTTAPTENGFVADVIAQVVIQARL